MKAKPELKAVACNYLESTKTAVSGALCYVVSDNPGNDNDRVEILSRSRSGRWIQKWESIKRLGNFRVKIVPPSSPRYEDLLSFYRKGNRLASAECLTAASTGHR